MHQEPVTVLTRLNKVWSPAVSPSALSFPTERHVLLEEIPSQACQSNLATTNLCGMICFRERGLKIASLRFVFIQVIVECLLEFFCMQLFFCFQFILAKGTTIACLLLNAFRFGLYLMMSAVQYVLLISAFHFSFVQELSSGSMLRITIPEVATSELGKRVHSDKNSSNSVMHCFKCSTELSHKLFVSLKRHNKPSKHSFKNKKNFLQYIL